MIALGIIKRHYEAYQICKFEFYIIDLLLLLILLYYLYSGPGAYNNEEKTTFRYLLDHQPMSRRGYTFNARTEKRKTFEAKVIEEKILLYSFFLLAKNQIIGFIILLG
jgi:hypothetical protein